jgi:multisubunit Na+/H+ antiporter MnhE subunit
VLLANLLLALAWAALQGDFSLRTLLTGQLIGYLILVMLIHGGVLRPSPYIGRVHRVVGQAADLVWGKV